MSSLEYNPYAIAESEQPIWRPGEELAASAFLGMTFLYFFDVNVSIIRVFKKKRGLYFWCLFIATWGCFINAIGVTTKYLVPDSKRLYGFYTLFMMGGWSIFAPMQLMVLYSRLHLVNDNPRVQRCVLIVILSTLFTVVLPTWIVVWPAYNPKPSISSVWSPRDAIVERYTQILLTLVECFVSGVYIWSLLGLMHYKSSLRQRRVMMDLIYVNIICVLFDILNTLLIYLNQLGLSHPIQVFGYILKLKLEFVVLNQLMAVAARGIAKQSFEERRYYKPTLQDTFTAEATRPEKKPTQTTMDDRLLADTASATVTDPRTSNESTDKQISAPSPTHQPSNRNRRQSTNRKAGSDRLGDIADLNTHDFGNEEEMELDDYVEKAAQRSGSDTSSSAPCYNSTSTRKDSAASKAIRSTFSGETLSATEERERQKEREKADESRKTARQASPHLLPRSNDNSPNNKKPSTLQSLLHPFAHHPTNSSQPDSQLPTTTDDPFCPRQRRQQAMMGGHEAAENALRRRGGHHQPMKATLRQLKPYKRGKDGEEEEEEEEEEIGVHMWERRGGEVVLDVPWFRSKVDGKGDGGEGGV